MKQTKVPSKKMYVLAGFFLFLGTGLFLVIFFNSGILEEDFIAVVPGTHELKIENTGNYTIFHEYRTVIDGKIYVNEPNIPGLVVALTEKESGQPLQLSPTGMNASYAVNGREGFGVLDFTIERPGTYILEGWYEGSTEGNNAVLAIKSGFVGSMLMAFGAFFSCFILAFILIFRTYLKRRKLKEMS